MDLSYAIADVFTRVPFGGNRLAVFPHARGFSDATMRALTREFGFPESTFVTPPATAGDPWGLRIFTPAEELLFGAVLLVGRPGARRAAVRPHVRTGLRHRRGPRRRLGRRGAGRRACCAIAWDERDRGGMDHRPGRPHGPAEPHRRRRHEGQG